MLVNILVLDRIRSLLGFETGIKAQLHKEMNNLIKKESTILKAILLTNDGLPIYSYGLDGKNPELFAVSISSFVSLVMRKIDVLGLKGEVSYVQIELDNGNILVAVSDNLSLATFTNEDAELTIVKTLTKNALKRFEELFR